MVPYFINSMRRGGYVTPRNDIARLAPLSTDLARLSDEDREWWRQGQQDFDKKTKELEEKIAKVGRAELDVLATAGVSRKSILKLLVLASEDEGKKTWADLMRLRQDALMRMANRMKTLAAEGEKCARDPFSKVESYVVLGAYGGLFGFEWPEPSWNFTEVQTIIRGMLGLAKPGKTSRLSSVGSWKRIAMRVSTWACLCFCAECAYP
jgi:hypothetical protein